MEPFAELLRETDWWRAAIEILILTVIVYQGYVYFRATRAARILVGLLLFIIGLALLSRYLKLEVIEWVVKYLTALLAVALVVLFQPELRRGLAELGSRFSSFLIAQRKETVADLVEVVQILAKRHFGALIAIERGISLKDMLETGVEVDAKLTPELMLAIFCPKAALHDGGVIFNLVDERIAGAGCVFPVSQKELLDRSIGLRHRAAIGVTEESDAIALVVSEETGHLSIAVDGELEQNLSDDEFRDRLNELLLPQEEHDETAPEPLPARLESETGGLGDRRGNLVRD